MSEMLLLALLGGAATLLGALGSTLLSIIIHELRRLRSELTTLVPQNWCRERMSGVDGRILEIERKLEKLTRKRS